MFSILVFILMTSEIEGKLICDTIKPEGIFQGIQIYRNYHTNYNYTDMYGKSHLAMNNRNVSEWQFNITFDGNYTLEVNHTIITTNVSAEHRFGIYDYGCLGPGICFDIYRNCIAFNTNTSFEVDCKPKPKKPNELIIESWSLPIGDYVVICRTVGRNTSMLLFSRSTKTLLIVFNSSRKGFTDCKKETQTQDCHQLNPRFILQMDVQLFSQIEGVVNFTSIGGKNGYLVLFRIDGRPKYCFTFEDEFISDECKSSENMRTLLEECFVGEYEDSSTTKDEQKIEKKRTVDPLVWVVIALVVIALINTVGILFANRRRRQKMHDFSYVSTSITIPKNSSTN